jgi:putative transposase
MGHRKRTVEHLDTIWEVPDAAWNRLEKILVEQYPPKKTGRPRADLRKVFNGIIYRLRSGVQWNHLPREFGDDSTVHRWFQRWAEDGVFEELWAVLLLECDELGGVEWKWQAADGCLGKARFGGAKRDATRPIVARAAPRRAS